MDRKEYEEKYRDWERLNISDETLETSNFGAFTRGICTNLGTSCSVAQHMPSGSHVMCTAMEAAILILVNFDVRIIQIVNSASFHQKSEVTDNFPLKWLKLKLKKP